MNSDHKPKVGQSHLAYTGVNIMSVSPSLPGFIGHLAYILPAERHNPWAACFVLRCTCFFVCRPGMRWYRRPKDAEILPVR